MTLASCCCRVLSITDTEALDRYAPLPKLVVEKYSCAHSDAVVANAKGAPFVPPTHLHVWTETELSLHGRRLLDTIQS